MDKDTLSLASTTLSITPISPQKNDDVERNLLDKSAFSPTQKNDTESEGVKARQERAMSQDKNVEDELEAFIYALNQQPEMREHSVRFVRDRRNGEFFTSLVNIKTDEVIREIPNEEVRELQMRVNRLQQATDQSSGLFVDQLI